MSSATITGNQTAEARAQWLAGCLLAALINYWSMEEEEEEEAAITFSKRTRTLMIKGGKASPQDSSAGKFCNFAQ